MGRRALRPRPGPGTCSSAANACPLETALADAVATPGTLSSAQVTIAPAPGVTSPPILDGDSGVLGQGTGPVAGAIPATSVDVISPMKIIATTGGPAKPGVFNVFVVTTGGPSIATVVDRYRYEQAPSVAGVHPNHGPSAGGNTLTIRGSHFTLDATVSFGATAASHVTYVSPGDLTVTARQARARWP